MRLHRLELSAFLAFPGREAVDFDALGEAGLFLLQGRTGAGKTALLDAICFAFYGEVPGARQEAARLRSDHAAPATPTEVALEATLRGRRVRITRSPPHERPKLRGEGTTSEPHRVRVEAVEEDGSLTVLATRHDEARAELGDLLGMTREQFCQVVLLPQGGFARFLHARSDEREKLLGDLFDVGRFAGVERWLRDRRHDAERALAAAMREVRDAVAAAAQVSGTEPPDGWDHAPELAVAWVEEQLVVAEASAATALEAAGGARAALGSAESALATGRELAARREEHARAVAAVAAWEARRPERDAAEAELAAARRAAPVHGLMETLAARAAAAESAAAAGRTAVEAAAAAGVRAAAEPGELRATARAMREDLGAASALLAREAALDDAAGALEALEGKARAGAEEAEQRAAAVQAAERRRPELAGRLEAARAAAARLPGLETAAAQAAERAEAAVRRDRLGRQAGAAREASLRSREEAVAAAETHTALLRRRLEGMAAELAAGLRPGEPCAVCGAAEHPAPAGAPGGGLVEAAAVEAAAAEAEARAGERDAAGDALAALEAALEAARAVAGDAPAADLAAASAAAGQVLAAARREARRVDALAAELGALDGRLGEDRDAGREAAEAAAAARAAAEQGREALAGERAAIAAGRGGAPSIAARVRALDAAAKAADAAAAALEEADARAREASDARRRAAEAARDAGFDDLSGLAAALRGDEACDGLEARLRRYDEGLAQLRAVAMRPELAAAAQIAPPDVAALEAAAATARGSAEAAHAELGVARRRRQELDALRDRLAAALAGAAPARERHAVVRELAELANGTSASNRLRMRLSAYVLAARLEEVAAAATVRLARMSGGRYALEHADDTARGNRRGGLDLRVIDAWTGRDRPPSSLSGGETFLASLALALGLADVVTAEAGGARLETLFVDEGFGSLDDEGTLDEVLEVLDGLRDGGRVVGVVSHVAELRQRIPVQLRVEKGRGGSRVVQDVAGAGAGFAAA